MITNREHIEIKLHEMTDYDLATDQCKVVAVLRDSSCDTEVSCNDCRRLNFDWLKEECITVIHDNCIYCKVSDK